MLLPELVLVEAAPDRVLLDVQDELGLALLELDDLRLDDRRDGVAAGAHLAAVDLVAGVDDRDVADHRARLLGEDVQLLAQGAERDLQVLEDRVRLLLVVEGLLLRAGDGVQALVVHATKAERLVGLDEVLAAVGEQHGLHELAGHAEVEQLAVLLVRAHLQDAKLLVERRVRGGAERDVDDRLLDGQAALDHGLAEVLDLADRLAITGLVDRPALGGRPPARRGLLGRGLAGRLLRRGLFLGHGSAVSRHLAAAGGGLLA